MNERDRIEYLMNLYGLTPSQFSDKAGIQRASVSHILSSRNKPSLEILLKIYHTFPGVELAWLVAGEGEPPTLDAENSAVRESEATETVDEIKKAPNMLFSFAEDDVQPQNDTNKQSSQVNVLSNRVVDSAATCDVVDKEVLVCNSSDNIDKRGASLSLDVDSDKRIKEIKIFYNNGTYETFLPEKS